MELIVGDRGETVGRTSALAVLLSWSMASSSPSPTTNTPTSAAIACRVV